MFTPLIHFYMAKKYRRIGSDPELHITCGFARNKFAADAQLAAFVDRIDAIGCRVDRCYLVSDCFVESMIQTLITEPRRRGNDHAYQSEDHVSFTQYPPTPRHLQAASPASSGSSSVVPKRPLSSRVTRASAQPTSWVKNKRTPRASLSSRNAR